MQGEMQQTLVDIWRKFQFLAISLLETALLSENDEICPKG
jgi:hypothetical protein